MGTAASARSLTIASTDRFKVLRAKAVVLATGGVGRAFSVTSNSWEYTRRRSRARLPGGRFADRHGVRAVPSHRNGLAAQRQRHSGHRRRPRRRRRAAQQRRQALHVRRHSGELQDADRRQRRRRLALHARRQVRPPSTGAADARSRRPLHQSRSEGGARKSARRRVPGHRLDQGKAAQFGRAHQEEAAQHVPPVQAARRYRHHAGADGSRPHHALHHGRRAGGWRHADVVGGRTVRRGRMRRRTAWSQSPGRQFALRSSRLRKARGRVCREVRQTERSGKDRPASGG